jgi:hypothetical protein
LYKWKVVGRVVGGRCQRQLTASTNYMGKLQTEVRKIYILKQKIDMKIFTDQI